MASQTHTAAADNTHPDPGTAQTSAYEKMGITFSTRRAVTCCAYLLPHLQPTFRLLDLGCGPGSITADLAQLVPHGSVVAVDISPAFLSTARALIVEIGLRNVEFIEADALAALREMPDASFDVAHAHNLLLHLPKPAEVLREMRRVVKPGGVVASRDCAGQVIVPEEWWMKKGVDIFERMCADRGLVPWGGKYMHARAREAGFEWAEIEMSSSTEEFSEPRLRVAWTEGTRDTLRQAAVGGGYATEVEMDEQNAHWEEWGKKEEARAILVHGEVLCRKK